MNSAENIETGIYTVNGKDVEFKFYTSLTAKQKTLIVKSVVDTVVSDGYYYDFLMDMVFDFFIVDFLTDIDLTYITESNDVLGGVEKFVSETNVAEIVKAYLGFEVEELQESIVNNIEYKTGIHRNPIAESLSSLLNTIEEKIGSIDTESLDGMSKVLSKITGDVTPEKMLDAYSKSDMFKKQYADILAQKNSMNNTSNNVANVIQAPIASPTM